MMPEAFTKTRLLAVEGADEINFFKKLLDWELKRAIGILIPKDYNLLFPSSIN